MELEAKLEIFTDKTIKLPATDRYYHINEFDWPFEIKEIQEKHPPEKFIIQTDRYYDNIKLKLKENDLVLRNRKESLYEDKQKISRDLITYKGPKENSEFKLRKEIEFSENPLVWKVFEELGFQQNILVKKFRWISSVKNEIALNLCFDLVENLGYFLELECFTKETDSQKNSEILSQFLIKEKLDKFKMERQSYTRLLNSI